MDPINYAGLLPQVNLGQQFLQGLQVGDVLMNARAQEQAKQDALARQQQYQTDLQSAFKKPSAEKFAMLTAKYPQQHEALKQSWNQLSEGQKAADFGLASKAYAALNANRPELAASLFEKQIETKKASGADTSEEQQVLDMLKSDPTNAKGFLGYSMFSADPDKYASSIAALGGEQRAEQLQPLRMAEAKASAQKTAEEAKTAAVTARYADSQAVADLAKKKWDITKIDEDIKIAKETNRIKAMEAAQSKESNALKREELGLKIEEAKRGRDEKIRENVASAESSASTADNMLNTIERIKKNPALNNVLGSVEGRLPSVFSDEGSNAIELIDTLGSQAFLSQVSAMKGLGALSNAEGEKLQSALQSLSRKQGEKQFRENLDEAARLIKKGREGISRRTGVPLPPVDTPAAPGARPDIESFFK